MGDSFPPVQFWNRSSHRREDYGSRRRRWGRTEPGWRCCTAVWWRWPPSPSDGAHTSEQRRRRSTVERLCSRWDLLCWTSGTFILSVGCWDVNTCWTDHAWNPYSGAKLSYYNTNCSGYRLASSFWRIQMTQIYYNFLFFFFLFFCSCKSTTLIFIGEVDWSGYKFWHFGAEYLNSRYCCINVQGHPLLVENM